MPCSPSTNTAIVPHKPIDLTASAVSSSRINLTWTDHSTNETGFQIYRKFGACSSPTAWERINTKVPNSTSYSNTGLTSGTTYSYRVAGLYRSHLLCHMLMVILHTQAVKVQQRSELKYTSKCIESMAAHRVALIFLRDGAESFLDLISFSLSIRNRYFFYCRY